MTLRALYGPNLSDHLGVQIGILQADTGLGRHIGPQGLRQAPPIFQRKPDPAHGDLPGEEAHGVGMIQIRDAGGREVAAVLHPVGDALRHPALWIGRIGPDKLIGGVPALSQARLGSKPVIGPLGGGLIDKGVGQKAGSVIADEAFIEKAEGVERSSRGDAPNEPYFPVFHACGPNGGGAHSLIDVGASIGQCYKWCNAARRTPLSRLPRGASRINRVVKADKGIFVMMRWLVAFFLSLGLSSAALAQGDLSPRIPNASADTAQTSGSQYDYKLGPGDKVRVIVFGEESLSGEFLVPGGAGTIAYPLIGDVQTAGLTVPQLQAALETKLRDGILKEPHVSIEVLNYRPFYILGEVVKPGEYPYTNGLTVMNAVATANGFTYRANTRKVYIKRANAPSESELSLTTATPVEPGDTIRIGERFF